MGLYVYDGHGLWTLQALSDYNQDGSLKRGYYFKKTSEANQASVKGELTGSSLLKLEKAEQITRARLGNPETREVVLKNLSDSDYRGALIYAAVDDTTVNFQSLYTRCVEAKKEWDLTAAEAGLPVQTFQPGPIISSPSTSTSPLEDSRPEWEKLGFASKEDWKKWVKAGKPDESV